MDSGTDEQPWSSNPNAPQVSYHVYVAEKAYLAGFLIGAILYGSFKKPPLACPPIHAHCVCSVFILGFLISLFFKCMTALLNPVNRRGEGIKWGLVSYTVVMFSVVTVYTAMNLHMVSISFIDNREFPGAMGDVHPGPYGYFVSIYYKAISVVPNAAFCLNNWLADGLLVSLLFDAVDFPQSA